MLLILVICTQLFPFVILITPLYAMFFKLGLINSLASLIISYIAINLPFAIYLLLGYLDTIPIELDEAARIDGATRLQAFILIVMPLSVPGIIATAISSFIGAINGYLFAKWKFRGSDVIFTLLLFGFFIPYQSILLPMVRFLQIIGGYGQVWGLVLVHVIYGIPITTLIFRNYFAGVPNELLDASRVDGAGLITTFTRVMLPLSIPAFVVVGIFQFTNIWNDFLFGVTVVPNPARQPVTIALNNLSGTFSVDWNVVMAGAVLAALPTAVIYILLGRFFIRGILAGSIKG